MIPVVLTPSIFREPITLMYSSENGNDLKIFFRASSRVWFPSSTLTMDQNWDNTSWSKDNSVNRGGAGPKKARASTCKHSPDHNTPQSSITHSDALIAFAENSSETKKFRNLEDADEAGTRTLRLHTAHAHARHAQAAPLASFVS